MGIAIGPRITLDNLILNMDAESIKCYGEVNFIANSSYSATDWLSLFPANTTITTGIDAPDGTNTAVRVTCANTGPTLFRVNFPSFNPSGIDSYVSSFYARLRTPTFGPGTLSTDVNDSSPAGPYGPSLIANTWVRFQITGIPTASSKSFIDLISDSTTNAIVDFWGVQLEPGKVATPLTVTTGSTRTAKAGKIVNTTNAISSFSMTPYGGTYWDASPERFETMAVNQTANTGIIVSPQISLPDTSEYTLEFWVKLRTSAEANYHSLLGQDGTTSWVTVYTNNTTGNSWYVRYRNINGTYVDFSTQTSNIQTTWTHLALATTSSRSVILYINGVETQTLSSATTQLNISRLAAGYNSGGNFYPLQGAMAIARIYGRRLTREQIADSYRADRTRFGLT